MLPRFFVFLLPFFIFIFACSCSKKANGEKDDGQPTDNEVIDNNIENETNDIFIDDSDAAVGHPPQWTISEEEDIPWAKDGILKYYQWGTAAADTPLWTKYHNNRIYVGGTLNFRFDHSTDADMYLKIITDNKKVKTYQWGTDRQEIVTGAFAIDNKNNIYVIGTTTGDMGKIWTNSGYINTDCIVTVLNTTTDSFSFTQWGNEKSCEPRALYLEDDGTVVVVGVTNGRFPNQTLHGKNDIFISRIKNGLIETTQFGYQSGSVNNPVATSLKTESTFYICGNTTASLPGNVFYGGSIDGFIIGIDRKSLLPSKYYQIGTAGEESLSGLALGENGKIYFVGSTNKIFPGFANKGNMDFFYGHIENDTVIIDKMAGTVADDYSESCIYQNGLFLHTGSTKGDCGGTGNPLNNDNITLVANGNATIFSHIS
ncbi:MAG TPA: hypothetical protein PLV42_02095 [bacterium]|nr:hypothetical protein [bacterium]